MTEKHDDFDFEPIPGLPELPPQDEKILWQGSPSRWSLAINAFHVRKLAIYFGLLVTWQVVSGLYDGLAAAAIIRSVSLSSALAGFCLILIVCLAWGYSRSTIYTITSKRLVLRHGIALPMSINIPFSKIDSAQMTLHGNDTGTISTTLSADNRLAWLALWPNVRPWKLKSPEPAIRCIENPQNVANLLASAMAANEDTVIATTPVKVRTTQKSEKNASMQNSGLHSAATV